MALSKPETLWRHDLTRRMQGLWSMTWHEDRQVSPGVPDMHYSMGPMTTHRIGWLELKAKETPLSRSNHITVEPSQHQYIPKWLDRMPIHFLIRVRNTVFLIDGIHHDVVRSVSSDHDLMLISRAVFPVSSTATELPPLLDLITRIKV